MPSGADVDEIVVAVTVKREVAAMNESMMPSGSNDEELVLEVAVERHEAAMKTTQLICAGVDDDALVVIVDVAREEVAVVVSAVVTVVGKSWLEDWKTDVLYLIRSSRELVIEKEEEGE